ncbi:16S rRNA (guanine(527)-N(7))-methyltransferase RsmG [Alcaligenes endophyticus]|uniref:Ribosomal RNA small subunit methyltransferase G n=1 Tax=Alcaligenes endophyticus TaxID=1929088 RepID=A0ABT8EF52_9BURK|nr:16S rRNA (guanine(527)-N(7))-methyltransferase RsmG [Alcaligenes endophyticus]MCX5590499.1 16S rRNA (guanine(527)-N(7))-methyltransferase RsmG [Alcaligenes endophyticus]MDN4119837.1 16S rRNA (guanine(527)-N(7))-methyltransferase RsmG [Alcaligenes endophyticus]
MKMDFTKRLHQACEELELFLSTDQQKTLLRYIEQLAKWNKTYNLTALRDPEQMLIQHLFDSLSIIKPVSTYAAEKDLKSLNIVDVGSGAGLPGVVLAIACSTWNITCIDAVEKKMAFVKQMAGVLSLSNLQARHTRVEELPSLNADLITSRAFSSLLDFVKLASKHVKPGGMMLAMKGKHPLEEIVELESGSTWKVSTIEPLIVPELAAQRCLVWLSSEGSL